jgi:hypothetical protein
MQESDWRYVVDVILYIFLGGMTLIGVLLGLVIPAGPVAAESAKYFFGLHRHQWGNIHAYLSMAFVILMAVHIVLNWKWITSKTRQIFTRCSTPALVATACAPLLVLFLFWVGTPKDSEKYKKYGLERYDTRYVQREAAPELTRLPGGIAGGQKTAGDEEYPAESTGRTDRSEEEHRRNVGSLVITGRMSLLEIERATGLSGRTIADKVGLPPTVSLSEPLGRLRRQYGFEIQAVRDVVDRMIKEQN